MLLMLQSNPLTPIWQYGAATGSAFICVGLFIWSQVQIATFKATVDANTKSITESNKELKSLIEAQSEAQKKQSQAQEKLAESVHQLAEGVKAQSQAQHEQLDLIREMVSEQRVLSANQQTIMNGFQRVVEQLIDAVRE